MGLRPGLRWSRVDNLVALVVIILGIVVTALAGILSLVWITPLLPAGGGGVPEVVTVHRPGDVPAPRIDAETTSQDITVSDTGRMVIEFHDPTTVERFLMAVPALLGVTATLVVLVMVYRLVQSLDIGDPFVPANVRRVYVVAFTVLASSLVIPVVGQLCDGVLGARALGSDGLTLYPFALGGGGGVSPGLVFTGFLLAGLAEVFRRGTRLREDVHGLV